MNINMTKNEFHDLISIYLVEMSTLHGDAIDKGTPVTTPILDEFLLFLKKKTIPINLRQAYFKSTSRTKLNYRRLEKAIEQKDEVNIRI